MKIWWFLSENDDVLTFTLISTHATSIKHLTELHNVKGLSNSIADYIGGYGDQPEGEWSNLTVD